MIKLTESKIKNIKTWEGLVYDLLLKAESQDICTRNEMYRELSSIQKDVYMLKAMMSFKKDLIEHKRSQYNKKFNEIYLRLKRKIKACKTINSFECKEDKSLENVGSILKIEKDLGKCKKAQEIFEEWFKKSRFNLTDRECEKFSSLLNRLTYFSDRAVTRHGLFKGDKTSRENFGKLKENLKKCQQLIDHLKDFQRRKEKSESK